MFELLAALTLSAASLSPSGNIMIQGDPDEWRVVQHDGNERVTTTILLRPGETSASWYDMLTVMDIHGGDVPRVVIAGMRDRLLAACPQASFVFHRDVPDDVLYEFQSGDCESADGPMRQHEIGRVTRGPGGAFRVAYAVNSARMSPELQRRWTTLLDGRLGTAQGFPIRNLVAVTPAPAPAPGTARVESALAEARTVLERQDALLAELDRLGAEATEDARAYARGGATEEAGLLRVRLHLGRGDGTPGEQRERFKTTEGPIWAVMPLSARAGATVRADWYYERGEAGSEQMLRTMEFVWDSLYDTARSYLSFNRLPPPGIYRVEIFVDGRRVGLGRFEIYRASPFG
jgi:hypothetical protein